MTHPCYMHPCHSANTSWQISCHRPHALFGRTYFPYPACLASPRTVAWCSIPVPFCCSIPAAVRLYTSLLQHPRESLCIPAHPYYSVPVNPCASLCIRAAASQCNPVAASPQIRALLCSSASLCIPAHPYCSIPVNPCASLHTTTTESVYNSAHLCASLLQHLCKSLLQHPFASQMKHPSCSIPAHLCAASACALAASLLQHPHGVQAKQVEKLPPWHRGVQGGNLVWFAIRMAAGASTGPEFLAECCAHSAYLARLCLCSRSQPALWGEGHGRAPTEEHRAVLGIKSLPSLCTVSILGVRRDMGVGTGWCGTRDCFSSHLVLANFPAPCPGKATAKHSACIQAP